jgi:hypothetical protein
MDATGGTAAPVTTPFALAATLAAKTCTQST